MPKQRNPKVGRVRSNPRYYEGSEIALSFTDGKASMTWDLNQDFNDFASSTRAFGERAKVHHFAWKIAFDYTTVPGASADEGFILQNLLVALNISTSTPNVPDYMYQTPATMAQMVVDTACINPSVYQYLDEVQIGTTRYPPLYSNDNGLSGGDALNQQFMNLGKAGDISFDPFMCASKPIQIAETGGGTAKHVEYIVPMPVCEYSGCKMMDPLRVDNMPLELFSSSTGKALFKISYADSAKPFNTIMGITTGGPPAVFTPVTGVTIKFTLMAYIVFETEGKDPYTHGVTWKSEPLALTTTGQTVAPDYYRLISVGIPPADTYADGAEMTHLQFSPFDFQSVKWDDDKSRISWTVDGTIVWPSNDRNFARELVADWNAGFVVGNNPKLYYDRGKGNLFVGDKSSLGGATIEINPNFTGTLGFMTFMPILPLAFSHPAKRGFAPTFIQDPSSNSNPQIKLLQWALNTGMVQTGRSIVLAGSVNAIKQRSTIRMYCISGSAVGTTSNNWQQLIDGKASARSGMFSLLVPEILKAA